MTSDAEGSFRSHANYLRALATLAGHTTIPMATRTKAMAGQRAAVFASTSLHDRPHGGPDLAGVRRSLANAWGTELLLGLSREYAVEDDLVRLANNWGAVQAYYVVYHAFQAYMLATAKRDLRHTPRPRECSLTGGRVALFTCRPGHWPLVKAVSTTDRRV